MSANFGSSKEGKEVKISRQMNRSQKLKRKNTCKRPYPTASLPSWSIERRRGRGQPTEAKLRTANHCLGRI